MLNSHHSAVPQVLAPYLSRLLQLHRACPSVTLDKAVYFFVCIYNILFVAISQQKNNISLKYAKMIILGKLIV